MREEHLFFRSQRILVNTSALLSTTHHYLLCSVLGAFSLEQVVSNGLAQRAISTHSCVLRLPILCCNPLEEKEG